MLKQILAFQNSTDSFPIMDNNCLSSFARVLVLPDSIGGVHLYYLEQIFCFNIYLKERKKTDFIQLVGMPFGTLKFRSFNSLKWLLQSTSTKDLLLSCIIHPSSQEFYLG